jgi:hypothetical protein
MKKYTYEVTIEAEGELEACRRMKGLELLTGCIAAEKPATLTLSEEEEQLVSCFRKAGRTSQLLHLIMGDVLKSVFPKEKKEDTKL